MAETIEPTNELAATAEGPELYVRVAIEKQAKGYKHETTVSIRWVNTAAQRWDAETNRLRHEWLYLVETPMTDGPGSMSAPYTTVLDELLEAADAAARKEIARREALDAAEKAEATP